MQIGTNHLGHFALTNLLLPHITDRVVTVSSGAHRFGAIRLDDLNWEHGDYQRWPAYGQSKLANLLFTLELQRRLTEAGSPVRALAAHPGCAATNLQSRTENPLQKALMALGNRCSPRATRWARCRRSSPPRRTCPGALRRAGRLRRAARPPGARGAQRARADPETARRLWELSEGSRA